MLPDARVVICVGDEKDSKDLKIVFWNTYNTYIKLTTRPDQLLLEQIEKLKILS